MFEFNSGNGTLTQNGQPIENGSQCYSGHGAGLNNPAMEQVQGEGPLPRGKYKIGPAYDDPHLGPVVMHLDPLPGTNEYGRSLFRMHGDNAQVDHTASDGCVIAARNIRELVAASQDKILLVYSGPLPTQVTS